MGLLATNGGFEVGSGLGGGRVVVVEGRESPNNMVVAVEGSRQGPSSKLFHPLYLSLFFNPYR